MTDFDIEVFFDGDCPLCLREIRLLQRLDRRRRIVYTDIAAPDFRASDVGIPWNTLMATIHGRLPDGTILEGVEVFRRLYTAVGFGSLVGLSRLPGVADVAEMAYEHFAKNRLRLTGRCHDQSCVTSRPATACGD